MEYGEQILEDITSLEDKNPLSCSNVKMDYGNNNICKTPYSYLEQDENQYRFVGFPATISGICAENYRKIFSEDNVNKMSKKITELLQGVEKNGRNILVPNDKISHILSQVYNSQRPEVGDIYSRYQIGSISQKRNDVREIIDRTINIIVTQIKNEMLTEECNKKLSVWSTILGDFNIHGLRAHSQIKLKNKRSQRFQFHMHY